MYRVSVGIAGIFGGDTGTTDHLTVVGAENLAFVIVEVVDGGK